MGDPVDRYLTRYAEPEARHTVDGRWDRCVVVPIRDETSDFLEGLRELAALADTLVIAVVNGPEPSRANLALLRELTGREALIEPTYVNVRGLDIVVVDRASTSRGLGRDDGVGLARKIGLDLGLALWHRGQLASPWLRTTDADATLRLEGPCSDPAVAATTRIAPFWHGPCGDAAVDRATARYEVWLRHYVAGLAFAGSDWAYPTIGSTLEVQATAYAAVRGVPRRQAGEDFHLLAKLAKLGPVEHGGPVEVTLQSRVSNRVPFGTGPAVARAIETGDEIEAYDPRVFEHLRELVRHLEPLSDPDRFRSVYNALSIPTQNGLQHLGLGAAAQDLHRLPRPDVRHRRLREWFDAKRTLRFVHHLRDAHHPDLPWPDAVRTAPWLRAPDFDPNDDLLVPLRRLLSQLPPPRTGIYTPDRSQSERFPTR